MSQTTVQESTKIQFGSGKFEVSPDGVEWIDLGAMRNIVWNETWEKVTVKSDNAGVIKTKIKNHQATLGGDIMELSLKKLNVIRGGIDEYEATPGVSETLSSGGKTTITPIQARVTNENEVGEIFRATLFKASNNKGIEIAFQPDDADDPNMVAIEMQGDLDVTRDKGKQLFELYNEQGESVAS